jgi:acetyl-CoA acetyltransferase
VKADDALSRAAIVGAAESDLGLCPDYSAIDLIGQAASRAAADAGLPLREIDGLFTVTPYHHLTTLDVSEYLGIRPSYHESTNVGGCSFVLYLRHAAAAISAGLCTTALICYGSTQRSDGGKLFSLAERSPYEEPYGLQWPLSYFGLIAQRHMAQYGTKPEQLAEIAVANRKWAALTPAAFKRDPITVEDVLSSRMITSPLHLLDCCLVTDGGAAVILTSRERARSLRRTPVRVLGAAESTSHRSILQMPDYTTSSTAISGPRAMQAAGVTHTDIDFCEYYDATTIAALMMHEDLGFCAKGEGGDFVSGQRTAPGGSLPTNTNGGGLSYTHPGMLGLFLVVEAVRQLRWECGDRQVPNANIGLVSGLGGGMCSSAVAVLSRDA